MRRRAAGSSGHLAVNVPARPAANAGIKGDGSRQEDWRRAVGSCIGEGDGPAFGYCHAPSCSAGRCRSPCTIPERGSLLRVLYCARARGRGVCSSAIVVDPGHWCGYAPHYGCIVPLCQLVIHDRSQCADRADQQVKWQNINHCRGAAISSGLTFESVPVSSAAVSHW